MSRYIFGPVPSRRLGRSLGVDLVPFKTCTYDCIYCQLGRTPCTTTERKEWVPLDGVLEDLRQKLSTRPDYITLSGSGEPTLYSRLDELIDRIKTMTDVPVAVLTNGALFADKELRRQLMEADLVVPSLDAGDEAMFQMVNRPHQDISFEHMLQGLIDFRREYQGKYWLEGVRHRGLHGHSQRTRKDRPMRRSYPTGSGAIEYGHSPTRRRVRLGRIAAAAGRADNRFSPSCRGHRRLSRRSSPGGVRRRPGRHPGNAPPAALFPGRHCRRTRHAQERSHQVP